MPRSLLHASAIEMYGVVLVVAWAQFFAAPLGRAEEISAFRRDLERGFAAGETERALGRCDSAVAEWRRTLAADVPALAGRIEAVAELLLEEHQYQAALPLCRELLELRQNTAGPESLEVAPAYDLLVQAQRGQGDFPAARRLRERQIEILRHGGAADTLVGDACYGLGKICYDQHDYPAAEAAWRQALARFESASPADPRKSVWCLNDLADTRRIAGDFTAAESLLVLAVERSAAHLPRNSAHARLLNNLGALYWDLDRLDEAERLYREALQISADDSGATRKRLAIAHLNLGVLTRDQGKTEEAEKLLLRALDLARAGVRDQDPPGFVYFLNEPARLYAGLGRWDEAIRLWEEALDILSGLKIPHEIYHAQILNDTAEALLARGDRARAEGLYRQALAKRERVLGPTHPEVGVALTGLARAVAAGPGTPPAAAAPLLARALAIFATSSAAPEVEAEAWALEARLDRAAGKQADARLDLERALALVEELRPRRGGGDEARIRFLQRFVGYYDEMIAWLVESGQSEAALEYAERIRARVLHEQLAAGRADLHGDIPAAIRGPLERRERDARARIARIQQDITLARATWTPTDSDGIARLTRLERDLDAALGAYREVAGEIQLHSPVWQRLLQRPATSVSLAAIQAQLLRPDEILLLYQIGSESSFLFVVPPAPQRLECHALAIPPEVGAALGVQPEALRAEVLTALVAGRNAAERAQSVVGGIVRLRKVTGVAPIGADAGRPVAASGIEPAPPTARQRAERSHLLWRLLLPESVWSRVRAAAAVVIVPDGSLHQLPFEALVVDAAPAGGDIRYWLDVGPAIRYANSITTLLDIAARQRGKVAPSRVLTVCDPVFDPLEVSALTQTSGPQAGRRDAHRQEVALATGASADLLLRRGPGLPKLPATARESESIRRAFGPQRVEYLRGLDATETRVKSEVRAARYIHIATHGIVDESHDELLAALLFTPPAAGARGPADDGCLHLFEIYELPLDCELAVLSACETESGRRIQGEGVFALSRGFLVAGAQRTVASLWPVADESTAWLIADFFQRVAAAEAGGGAIDYAGFLRAAKLALRRQPRWSEPSFWAPFVLSGAR